jgi:hypothetical protein
MSPRRTRNALHWVEENLEREQQQGHKPKQLQRFVWALLVSLYALLAADDWHFSWKLLWAACSPALWVTVEQLDRRVSLKVVLSYLHAAAAPDQPEPAPDAYTEPVPPATAPDAPDAPPPAAHP